jgi:hypothetical protein
MMSSIVIEVSAILVAMTTFRIPAAEGKRHQKGGNLDEHSTSHTHARASPCHARNEILTVFSGIMTLQL